MSTGNIIFTFEFCKYNIHFEIRNHPLMLEYLREYHIFLILGLEFKNLRVLNYI